MNAQQLLNGILPILHSVKEDKEKLQKILDFLLDEIYENPVEEEPERPERYRELVKSIAQSIDCGMVCFINPETLEVEETNRNQYREEINGFYNDDGTKIDPDSVPVPGLCIICRKHQIDDWDENLLCLMNRNDQRNETDFKCGAFEKIY